MSLPSALEALGRYPQFIACRLIPGENGKNRKLPCDWRTGKTGVNPLDPQYWGTYEQITTTDYVPAFVLTDNDPFFCLDLDSCLETSGNWSARALSYLGMFPGAACEVSLSGKGLHVWGTYQSIAPHSCKNSGLGLELYHTQRFIALGHPNASGSILTDCTVPLNSLISHAFGATSASLDNVEWTDAPSDTWRGPEDDDELIRRALKSGSVSAAFGGRARFVDLWEANVEILSTCYPTADRNDGKAYDASSVDAALAAHLRFWTGGDCERIKRLMLRSGLVRDKYEREDYLHRTILTVVANGGDVYQEQESAAAIEARTIYEGNQNIELSEAPRLVEGSPYASPEDQVNLFHGCIYITDVNKILVPNGQLLDQQRFKARYGGFAFVLDQENGKTVDDPWTAFLGSRAIRFPKVDGSCFRPDLPSRQIMMNTGGLTKINTYIPVDIPRKEGDISPFMELVNTLFPVQSDRDIILAYMAFIVQHKGVKAQWAPLIQGVEGNGKSTLGECVAEAVGREYSHFPKASQIAKNFNAWMYRKIFYGVEDIYVGESQREVLEELKPMITRTSIEIEFKGIDKLTLEVCGNFILNTNYKDGIRKSRNDRRIAPFYTPQQEAWHLGRDGLTENFFRNLYNWLKKDGFAIVSEYLYTYEIPEQLNPAFGWRAPQTTSTEEAILTGLGKIEQEILECVERGQFGFAGGWVSGTALDRLLDSLHIKMARNKRRDMMNNLGYTWHPVLPDGRVNNPILEFGNQHRPKLFIKQGHLALNLKSPSEVVKAYLDAQERTTLGLSETERAFG